MKTCRRAWFLLVVVLGLPGGLPAQNLEPSSSSTKEQGASVPRPKRKSDLVITNDPVALLAVRRTPGIAGASEQSSKKEASAAGLDEPSKAAETASLEQQIRDKQNRISLLMRLFVNDEKAFLMDPSSTNVDAVAVERRQFEQDELRWETAELSKLRAELQESKGKGGGR